MKRRQGRKTHQVTITFSDEKVTSFGGMILEHRLASRLGLWRMLEKQLPERAGRYSWLEILQAGIAGLLSGARGSFATEELRGDAALLEVLELSGAPHEVTFWRCLEGLGGLAAEGVFNEVQAQWTRQILSRLPRRDLLRCEGFLPIFADGSLLEGSPRREGTKYLRDKGAGLLWATVFAGPFVAAQGIAKEGESEQGLIRRFLPEVVEKVLRPLKLDSKALLLADSLHGNEPTLRVAEEARLRYVVGAASLARTEQVLQERSSGEWRELGPDRKRGWSQVAVCQCWIQCKDWPHKRLLIGRRVMREGEMIPFYYGVLTNLTPEDLNVSDDREFIQAVWRLYDEKGRLERLYQELLSDLNLHHPPCRQHKRNAGFYALATLAHTLGVGVKLIGSRGDKTPRRPRDKAKGDNAPESVRIRPGGDGMRLWRLRRHLLTLPARISRHARQLCIQFLGVPPHIRDQLWRWYNAIATC